MPTLRLFPKGKQNAAKHHEIDTRPHKHILAMQIWLKENSVAYATAFPEEKHDPKLLNSESEEDGNHPDTNEVEDEKEEL